MAIDSVTNFARSTTSGSMTNVSPANGGTFSVTDGSAFPTSNFYVVIDIEIILISSRSGNTFTVDATNGRAQRGTAAASHIAGSSVFNGPLAHHVSESAYLSQQNFFTTQQVIDVNSDIAPLILTGHTTQTSPYLYITNDAADRQYLTLRGEIVHNQNGVYFRTWSSAVTAGSTAGFQHDFVLNASGASATNQYSLFNMDVSIAQNFTGDLTALAAQVNWSSTGTHSTGIMVGVKGSIVIGSSSAGTVTTAHSVLAAANIANATTITTLSLLKATTPASTGSATNMYGLWVDPMTKGGTLSVGARVDTPTGGGSKYCLWLSGDSDSTAAAGGVTFGASKDTNLYRSAANTLKTDDALIASTVTDGSVLVLKQTVVPFSKGGVLTAGAGTFRFYVDGGDWTIIQVRASVGTAPTGASLIVDVNKNGTTIFTTQSRRPTIAASGFTATPSGAIEVTSLTTADYLTVDIDQIGSTIAGSDLVVTVWLQRA